MSTIGALVDEEVIVQTRYSLSALAFVALLVVAGCSSEHSVTGPELDAAFDDAGSSSAAVTAFGNGATTANGWYEGEEIYYIDNGPEEGVTSRGQNDLYLVGGNRLHQANVAEFIPGEPGYSPHWNIHVVHSAPGVTVQDILDSEYDSEHFPEALFDDAEDVLAAQAAGLVTIDRPGVVVHCPVISEKGAEAPGNNELPEVFDELAPGDTF